MAAGGTACTTGSGVVLSPRQSTPALRILYHVVNNVDNRLVGNRDARTAGEWNEAERNPLLRSGRLFVLL
jgi:hypothetical protein